jgi:SAM-dependent methyltransferase
LGSHLSHSQNAAGSSLPKPPLAEGLARSQFRQIARNGFGDSRNSYAHAMTSFRGRLFVGTTRNMFQLVKIAPDPATSAFHLWPVRVPPDLDAAGMDQRCQIWRFDPADGRWAMPFESPRVPMSDGTGEVWRDFGYRNMVVQKTESDAEEALYVTTMSSSKAPGALILRSPDGERFEPITEPGMGNSSVSSFRAFAGFRNRLYASPAGRGRLWAFSSSVVLECRDPVSRVWTTVNEPGFGDSSNVGVFDMGVFNDHLYAGVGNPFTGLQVWKTDCRGEPPYRWTKILDHGAGRGKLNQAAMSMCEFQGALYIGTGIRRGGYDREFKIGPAAGELLRIFPDDSWELVMGEEIHNARVDRQPLSDLGPGFDNPFNGYIWAMAVYDNNLYVGTYNNSVFLWWIDPRKVSPETHRHLRRIGVEKIVEREAGFNLWRSPDGIHWFEVSGDGFGNPYNYGVRTLHGCESGLYVGTANPFGPDVAVRTAAGWTYSPNPRGGLEIWEGRSTPQALHSNDAGVLSGDGRPSEPRLDHAVEDESGIDTKADGSPKSVQDPLLDLAEYWSFSRFKNQGYWTESTENHQEAGEDLLEKILEFLPTRQGTVLDVGCGSGATTEYLGRFFGPRNVTGIDISEHSVECCQSIAPESTFLVMNATQLDFEDASFDHVVCVESASRFRTRDRFLREAHRVLKPGGSLLITDELFARSVEKMLPLFHPRNFVSGPRAYSDVLVRNGFESVRVIDATFACALRSSEYFLAFCIEKFNSGELEPRLMNMSTTVRMAYLLGLRYYILAAARKPRPSTTRVEINFAVESDPRENSDD